MVAVSNTTLAMDQWDTHADALWVSYIIINGIGGVLASLLIYHIWKLGDEASSRFHLNVISLTHRSVLH
jgi:hypothetical protein